ncbi:MAG TPA: FecR domain-containing protein, partial [Puia sp.]|nr:FecR domain-containing protein [Puia sp.]
NGRISRSTNDDPFYGYYLDRPLVCDSVPMERVVDMLNKAYDAHIVIATDDIRSLPLTTVFRHDPLDRVLAVLGATFDIQVIRQGQTIILK